MTKIWQEIAKAKQRIVLAITTMRVVLLVTRIVSINKAIDLQEEGEKRWARESKESKNWNFHKMQRYRGEITKFQPTRMFIYPKDRRWELK